MAENGSTPTIVIKRIKKVAGGHHGGAWKIAYADFVTAMMAFFLLMWLLSSKPSDEREIIAQYFRTPLMDSLVGSNEASGSDATPSVLPAAGMDLIVVEGHDMRGSNDSRARTELERREAAGFESLMRDIEEAIDADEVLREFRDQLLLDLTSEGLRIQIVDEKNRSMFGSGSSKLMPYSEELLRALGKSLNETSHKLSISGHTDGAPFASGAAGFGNWELSSDRANAARRALASGGMREAKVLRVIGVGSALPLKPEAPDDPSNRRITIVVLNKATENAIKREGGLGKGIAPTNPELFAAPDSGPIPVPPSLGAASDAQDELQGGSQAPVPAGEAAHAPSATPEPLGFAPSPGAEAEPAEAHSEPAPH